MQHVWDGFRAQGDHCQHVSGAIAHRALWGVMLGGAAIHLRGDKAPAHQEAAVSAGRDLAESVYTKTVQLALAI